MCSDILLCQCKHLLVLQMGCWHQGANQGSGWIWQGSKLTAAGIVNALTCVLALASGVIACLMSFALFLCAPAVRFFQGVDGAFYADAPCVLE
jgi:hypothetical protein